MSSKKVEKPIKRSGKRSHILEEEPEMVKHVERQKDKTSAMYVSHLPITRFFPCEMRK